jgi:hypothetical protein
MSEAVIDMAGLDSQAAEVEAVDSGNTEVENVDNTEVETGAEGSEESSDGEQNSESSESSGSDKAGTEKGTKPAESAISKSISKVLKSITDNNPNDPLFKSAAKQLREAYFGMEAVKKEWGSVNAAREAKAFLSEVAGAQGPVTLQQAREAFSSTQALVQNIEESDSLVHTGDPKIWENIIQDLKSEDHLDALPKLASGGLDALKAHDSNAYEETILPHVVDALYEVGLDKSLNALSSALKNNNVEGAKRILGDAIDWMNKATKNVEEKRKTTSEETKIASERQKWESERTQKETKEFKTKVATELESYSNTSLGKALKPYLQLPFFKGFPRETLVDLGNGIKENLYAALEADTNYQTQMKGQWAQKKVDKEKISGVHKNTLDSIAADIVKKTIEKRYPGFAKGGSAAGRVAAAATKKAADTKASAQSVSASRPIYVASRPKDILREDTVIGGKKYTSEDLTMMQIAGRGFVKTSTGFRLVTWRR